MSLSNYKRNIVLATPFYIASILPLLAITIDYESEFEIKMALFGALGWWLALILRAPIILILKSRKLQDSLMQKIVVGISGPTEEIVRYLLLLWMGLSLDNVFSLAIGWAGIEVIYGIIQVILLGNLESKTDEKAIEAKVLMKQMGMDKTMAPSTPFWGALERYSAGLIHLAFSLFLLIDPLVLLVTIPAHSLVNYFVVKMNKQSLAKSQIGLLFISLVLVGLGLFLI